jgi:hypothetical protein
MDLPLDGASQQPMPRRIELDLIDPPSMTIVGAKDREVPLGAPAVLERFP